MRWMSTANARPVEIGLAAAGREVGRPGGREAGRPGMGAARRRQAQRGRSRVGLGSDRFFGQEMRAEASLDSFCETLAVHMLRDV